MLIIPLLKPPQSPCYLQAAKKAVPIIENLLVNGRRLYTDTVLVFVLIQGNPLSALLSEILLLGRKFKSYLDQAGSPVKALTISSGSSKKCRVRLHRNSLINLKHISLKGTAQLCKRPFLILLLFPWRGKQCSNWIQGYQVCQDIKFELVISEFVYFYA